MFPQIFGAAQLMSGGASQTLNDLMLALPGLLAYFPQTEASGTIADNAEGTAARDGAYAGPPTLQDATFPNGDLVAAYPNSGDYLNFSSADLAANMDLNDFWVILWALPDATEQEATAKKTWMHINGDGGTPTNISINHTTQAWKSDFDHSPNGATINRLYWSDWVYTPNYTMLAAHISGTTGYVWRNGTLAVTVTGMTQATDALNATGNNRIASWSTTFQNAKGAYPHFAIGSGQAITTELVNAIYEAIYPDVTDLFVTGDSYATDNDYWIGRLTGDLEVATGGTWRERPYRLGYTGQRVLYWNTQLAVDLPGISGNPSKIAVHICANDITAGTDETTVKTNLAGGIDQLRAKWPNADIYIAQPYRDDAYNGAYDAYALDLKQWILDVIATYPAHVFAGPDGNTWFKGANIDTYSSDRIHPTTNAGHIEFAAQWAAAMGY